MGLDETQSAIEMIRDSAGAIVSPGDLTRVRKLRYSQIGFEPGVWRDICNMGWPALRLPEERGGVGLGLAAYCALAEELGRGLVPEPLIPATLAAMLLDGDPLSRHLAGDLLVLPAWQASHETTSAGPLVVTDGRLTAHRVNVAMARGADAFLVIGPTSSALVAANAPGVTVAAETTQDGGHVAAVSFENAPCTVVEAEPTAALAEAALASSAYLLGMMDAALETTVAYLKTRTQFGTTIGHFQVLQHMAVDLRMEVEVARACIADAAALWDREGATSESLAAISRSKVRASRAALKVTREAIQLHGGIGFTDEHDVGLYLRKALAVVPQFGTPRAHRARYVALKPLTEAV